MKFKRGKRVLAIVLAAVMVLGLIPANMFLNQAKAATSGTVDLTKGLEKGKTYGDDSIVKIEVLENMTVKTPDSGAFTIDGVSYTNYVQGENNPDPKNGKVPTTGAAIKYTAVTDCEVTLSLFGNSKKTYYYVDSDENVIKTGEHEVPTSYALAMSAGKTYYFYLNGSKAMIADMSYKVVEGGSAEATSTTYTFDATTLTAAADKEALTGKVADDFITVEGTVTKRTNSSGGVKATEIGKKGTGGYKFTITGTATVAVTASSTGSGKESKFNMLDASSAVVADKDGNKTFSIVGAADSKKTYTYELEAGTYTFTTAADFEDRGGNVYSIVIEEYVAASKTTTYTFDATALTAAADKEALTGKVADDFITVEGTVTKRTNSSGGVKATEIGKKGTGGYKFTITGTATVAVTASSTGSGKESKFNMLDASGAVVADKDGNKTFSIVGAADSKKTYTYELTAGTYTFTTAADFEDRGGNVYSIVIEETTGGERPARKDWSAVEAPAFTEITEKDGVISLTYKMLVDYDGADSVTVSVRDSQGNELDKITSTKTNATLSWTPSASGSYLFLISAEREGETAKTGKTGSFGNFVLPLKAPSIGFLYNKGNGKVSIDWKEVAEATSYVVEYTADGKTWTSKNAGTSLEATVAGLTIGTEYTFRVVAKRGEDSSTSAESKIKIVEEAQTPWGYIVYGNGANSSNAAVKGDLNTDGKVQLTSGKTGEDGKVTGKSNNGKWVPASFDGINFYYTAVPASLNFTLRAKVTVDSWSYSNGQEAFGLIANDQLGGSGWNNSYSAYISKNEYYWDGKAVTTDSSATKVTQKLGIGAQEKIGITADNLAKIEANDTATIQENFKTSTYPLEQRITNQINLISNIVNESAIETEGIKAYGEYVKDVQITDMYLTIQKNNTGYFVTYESVDGSYKMTKKYYEPDALEQIDPDNVYVGFFTSRYAQATFSDVTFTTIDPKDDAPAEERPKEILAVNTAVQSPKATGNDSYEFIFNANCDGTLTIKDAAGNVVKENVEVKADTPVKPATVSLKVGSNDYVLTFTPDANYAPNDYTVMESYEPVVIKHSVVRKVYGGAGQSLWVAPNATGNGTKANPMSIYDAVKYVQAGQTIVIKEGTYNLEKTVTVERGIDGTAENKIYMVADPDAKTRPVFDFGGKCAGMVLAGDYWVFRGFDVTKSANGQKGMQISGDHNLVDSVNAYYNGNTGIQISRYLTTDLWEDWPSYNTILNCTSYGNADSGYEDADGFAAKLTIADGNVFDGCIAHHNADDGWDLFAKVQTGAIGSVTIKNSVAYANGYLEDGTNAGNGNGFKMGGDSMTGKHVLQNCVAYDNKAKGIDSNSCPDIIVKDCISFNNESYNVALYTNSAKNTDYSVDNVISFRFSLARAAYANVAENIKPVGSQDTTKIYKDTNYFWDVASQTSVNASGATVSAEWFKNLDTSTKLTRNADGTINMNDLLVLTDKAPAELKNAGIQANAGTASEAITVPESIKNSDVQTGDSTPVAMYMILALMSVVALGAVAFFGKKKFVK